MTAATCTPGKGRTYPDKVSNYGGNCTQKITTENECKIAAANNAKSGLGVRGYAGLREGSYYPPGCYEQNDYYYFNPNLESQSHCSSYRACICRTDVCHNCGNHTYSDQTSVNGVCKGCAPGKWHLSSGQTSENSCMNAPSSPSCGSGYVTDTVRLRSSGSCMAKILSLQECRNALDYNRKYNFENVSTDATYVRETYSSYYPPGCVFQPGSSYYTYNSNRYSTRNCDRWNKCVCETTKCVSISSQNSGSSNVWSNISSGPSGAGASGASGAGASGPNGAGASGANGTGASGPVSSQNSSSSNVWSNASESGVSGAGASSANSSGTSSASSSSASDASSSSSSGANSSGTSGASTATSRPSADSKKEIIKLRQSMQLSGLPYSSVKNAKASFESAIAKTLGVSDKDVEIISIREINTRRRQLLATIIVIVYEVKAKDEQSKNSLETKMIAAAFTPNLKTNMVAESPYSGFSITVDDKVGIIISNTTSTTTTTTQPPSQTSIKERGGERANSPSASDEEDLLSHGISNSWFCRLSFAFITLLMIHLSF